MNKRKLSFNKLVGLCVASTIVSGCSIYKINKINQERFKELYNNQNLIEEYYNNNNDYQRFLRIVEEGQRIKEERVQARKDLIEQINKENSRKNNVDFDENDVSNISNITSEEMRNVLNKKVNGALAQYASVFIEAEKEYGINAFFLAGIVAQESSWGKSNRARTQNNMTGHAVYSSVSRGSSFDSKESNILLTAKMLKENYLNPKGCNFNGKSIWDVNTSYCLKSDMKTPDYDWSKNICSIANDFVNIYHNQVKQIAKVPEEIN